MTDAKFAAFCAIGGKLAVQTRDDLDAALAAIEELRAAVLADAKALGIEPSAAPALTEERVREIAREEARRQTVPLPLPYPVPYVRPLPQPWEVTPYPVWCESDNKVRLLRESTTYAPTAGEIRMSFEQSSLTADDLACQVAQSVSCACGPGFDHGLSGGALRS